MNDEIKKLSNNINFIMTVSNKDFSQEKILEVKMLHTSYEIGTNKFGEKQEIPIYTWTDCSIDINQVTFYMKTVKEDRGGLEIPEGITEICYMGLWYLLYIDYYIFKKLKEETNE